LKYTFKESHNIKKSISYLISFYKNYLATIQEKNIYGLIHRDLHSRNILLDKEDIIITDWEGAVVTDYLYDLVMITRLYMKELTLEERIKLLRVELKTTAQKKRFMYLTLFYSIQTLGVDKKKDLSYIHTKEYLDEFENHIIPALFTN
jgi:thiamine kinase-like enzyme